MKVVGHLIVSNEQTSDICRALESIFPICDEILVVSDGTQPTTNEWLKNRVNIYNLKLFKNPFTTLREQRQFLLDKTELNSWVIALDADEAYSMATSKELRNCLLNQLGQKHYETSKKDNIPLCISIPVVNLVGDILHEDASGIFHQQKVFFYTKGLRWNFDTYFTSLSYSKGELVFGKDDTTVYSIVGPDNWLIKHYARLCPERLQWRKQHINDPKYGTYEANAWEKPTPKIVPLEESKW